MQGIIITSRDDQYAGFDIDGSWVELDEWNRINKSEVTLSENSYYESKKLNHLVDYYNYLKKSYRNKIVNIISINEPIYGFSFIGYDCGFLREDGEPLLFSIIYNELSGLNMKSFKYFIDHLNNYFLFDDKDTAKEYIAFRNTLKRNPNVNLESAYHDLTVEIVEIYLYNN